jgi:2-polyprenyl-6-methoxyphenol hydroxylase-like FAD-dependent oxidoreductase
MPSSCPALSRASTNFSYVQGKSWMAGKSPAMTTVLVVEGMPTRIVTTGCCIAGGGPAGMMLGYLLARAGVEVMVLEKHADFLRDFRGDTIHPSTLEVMHELGLLEEFLKRPHQELHELVGLIGEDRVVLADFSHLPTRCHFIAFMPQWDFLDFLADEAKTYPNFRLEMQAEVTDLVEDRDTVTGVRAKVPDGTLDVRADLVVGADGRHSAVRDLAGLEVDDLGAPMDVLWLRLSKKPEDGSVVLGRIQAGRLFVMLDRGDYWQCAFVIPKGGFAELRRCGLPAFRQAIVELNPALASRVREIASWEEVKLLTVRVDRLKRWYKPGVLCIGDAAHAMSPVGGVGINLAVQDAVAAANILAGPLKKGPVPLEVLRKVQQRRMLPTRLMQAVQIFVQKRIISNVLAMQTQPRAPFAVKLLNTYPWLRRLPGRLIGMGFRPEHVHTPEAPSQAK